MKIGIISDLHCDHHAFYCDFSGVDAVINAGDTHHTALYRDAVEKFVREDGAEYMEVLGNHDFYGGAFPKPGENQWVRDVGGVRFAGATLWTEATGVQFETCRRALNDSSWISGYNEGAYSVAHRFDLEFLRSSGADVVVTHHAPFTSSIHPMYAGDPVNAGFASDLESCVFDTFPRVPKLWVHGHTHSPFDYMLGDNSMRVICHPRGYPRELTCVDYRMKVVEL